MNKYTGHNHFLYRTKLHHLHSAAVVKRFTCQTCPGPHCAVAEEYNVQLSYHLSAVGVSQHL